MSDHKDPAEKDAEHDEAREEMRRFEQQDELPSDLSEWPDGPAKRVSFAEDEDQAAYGEGLTAKLGPELTHCEDGSVLVDGEKVDNPEDYKSDDPVKSPIAEFSAEKAKGE